MKKYKYIVFLDIDGVLNHQQHYTKMSQDERYKKFGLPDCNLSKESIDHLSDLTENPEVGVVISSTWRKGKSPKDMQEMLDRNGFRGKVISKTPNLWYDSRCEHSNGSVPRGCEIHQWIRNNYKWDEEPKYVIFDDDSDMLLWQKDNYFRIDGWCGITPNVVYRAKRFLGIKEK